MDTEPVLTLLVGLAGLVVIPLVAILAMITVVGAPLGLAILFVVWPAAAFAGYLVAGIWIGEWLLGRDSRRATGTALHGRRRRAHRPAGHQHRAVRRRDRQPVRLRGRPAPRLADVPPAVRASSGDVAARDSADGRLNHLDRHRHRIGASHGRADHLSAQPRDDLVDDRRPFGLVVELVAQARVGPALDQRRPGEDGRRRGRARGDRPRRAGRASGSRSRPRRARGRVPARQPASAAKRVVETLTHSGSSTVCAATDGSRDRVEPSMPIGMASVGTTRARIGASRFFQAGSVGVERRRRQDGEVWLRPVGQEVARGDEAAERVSVQHDRTPGTPRVGRPRADRRDRRGAGSSVRRRRADRPTRPSPDGRTPGPRGRRRSAGRRRARIGRSARRGRGPAGPRPTAVPPRRRRPPPRRAATGGREGPCHRRHGRG